MKNRILAVLLAAMLTTPMLFSCAADTTDESSTDTTAANDTTSTEPEDGWQYPDVDYGGGEYRILNTDELWNMYIHMDATEQTGEVLNDAVYDRNRKIEDELNCKIYEKQFGNTGNILVDIAAHAKSTIMAGADDYDVMHLSVNTDLSLITEGYLYDLRSVDGFQLDETWWDQDLIQSTTLNGKLYFASGASTLMAFDSMWCMFFNEDMMNDYHLEKPYDLVREGKWTIDKLTEYCTAVSSLNDDSSFTWNKDGSCVWGISTFSSGPEKFVYSAGVRGAEVVEDGSIQNTIESERFYNVIDKLANLLNTKSGLTISGSTTDFDADGGGYMYIFSTRRSLFLTAELKAAQLLRDMEDTFGLLPFPKFDEEQEKYYSTMVSNMMFLTIPTTNTKLEMTATISEVMAHDSYETVIPVYYNNVVEHKGLRNEESVEMLEILRANRGMDLATAFSWNNATRDKIRDALFAGNNQVASILASQKSVVDGNIEKFVEYLNQ